MKKFILLIFVLAVVTMLYGYTQFLNKGFIQAVLQYQLDFQNPPETVFAVSTFEQKMPDGTQLPKGTRFIGMFSKEENNFVIYFDSIQTLDGKNKKVIAKSILNIKEENKQTGVSAKISKTLYQQTKTNVLGAIFNTSNNIQQLPGTVLPRGSVLKIEID